MSHPNQNQDHNQTSTTDDLLRIMSEQLAGITTGLGTIDNRLTALETGVDEISRSTARLNNRHNELSNQVALLREELRAQVNRNGW